jgi:transposase
LAIQVSSANPHDTKLGPSLVKDVYETYPSIKTIIGDKGYRGTTANFIKENKLDFIVPEKKVDRYLSEKRWIVERTFSWLNHNRRTSKDYEINSEVSRSVIMLCGIKRNMKNLFLSRDL